MVFQRNERGSVLLIVLAVMACLTIFAATLGSLALNDQRQAVRQQKNNEAFYLARGGAEAVAAYLLENQELIQDYVGQKDVVTIGNGSFTIKVLQGPNQTILIESRGVVGNYSEKVTLSLIGGESSGSYLPVFDMAVFSNSNITLSSAYVMGRIGTNTTDYKGIDLDNASGYRIIGDVYVGVGGDISNVIPSNFNKINGNVRNLDVPRFYPVPVFPEFPSLPTKPDIDINWSNDPYSITEDGYYDTITVKENRKLIIHVGGEGDVRRIRVRNFNGTQGFVELIGEGTLLLYVDERFYMKGFFNGAWSYKGNPDQVTVFYRGSNDLVFAGETKIYASLFAMTENDEDAANLSFLNSGGIMGSIFTNAKNVEISGGSTDNHVKVFYAPNAHVSLSGSGAVYGAVIADKFTAAGGAKVEYHPDVEKVWTVVPEIEFDFEGNVESGGYKLGYWSN